MVLPFQRYHIDAVIGTREPDMGQGLGTFMRRYIFILYSNKFRISEPLLINKETLKKGAPFVLLAGSNFAVKKEVWNQLGGMETIFKNPAGEDVMLGFRLVENGFSILFNPQSRVFHFHPISLTNVFKKVFPRSEAIYLLSKYSNGFVNWKHFAESGHILDIKSFSLGLLFVIFVLLILSLLKASLLTILFLSLAILLIVIYRVFLLAKKLKSILRFKGERYQRDYQISLPKLFFFDQVHFWLKCLASLNFLICFLKDKYANIKASI